MTALTWACGRPRSPSEAAPLACVLTPEQVEGPYYLDDAHVRSDIREDRPGVPLWLDTRLVDVRSCAPVDGAAVDLWHCDAGGRYSGFVAESERPAPPFGGAFRGPPPGGEPQLMRGPRPDGPPPRPRPTDGARFLRGVQLSSGAGRARFTTIYPGWYAGRAVHIHVRVRTGGAVRGETYGGGHVAHTGQLYLPEPLSDRVFSTSAYAAHAGERMTQSEDFIFRNGGAGGLLDVSKREDGYVATVTIGIDPTATPPRR